jgi:hypothetical protein
MAKDTPSMAKNKMNRCFKAILDPHPNKKEIDSLWMYFNSCCAYCGKGIQRSSRTGHLDHVLSSAAGGTNSIYNHVLSCAICNGDEKREEDWHIFLHKKSSSSKLAQEREYKIKVWLQKAPTSISNPEFEREAEHIINKSIAEFDNAVLKLRQLSKST